MQATNRRRRAMRELVPSYALFSALLLASLICDPNALAQSFDSRSNGSDGALNLTVPGVYEFNPRALGLDPDGDHIFHFTSITIAADVTVRLGSKYFDGPVFWLASEAVQIDGRIDLNGADGETIEFVNCGRRASPEAGAGGFPGGVGRCLGNPAQQGFGPGGGTLERPDSPGNAGHAVAALFANSNVVSGLPYGNPFIVPLVGGSGGAGGYYSRNTAGAGGGGGGGALLVASSGVVTINGLITANGGNGGFWRAEGAAGGAGSGGAIRISALQIAGSGAITASGGADGVGNRSQGSAGRIRLEAFTFLGKFASGYVRAAPTDLFLPTSRPSVRITRIDGEPVNLEPSGQFTTPDIAINKTTATNFDIEARDIPIGTKVKIHVFSENGSDQIVEAGALQGSFTLSTATASIALPPGFSKGFVRAIWNR